MVLSKKAETDTFSETQIEGLQIVWGAPGTNGTHLTVTSGSAWIPSLGASINVPSTLSGPSMTFSASTWYYVYLTSAGALEISTTAPAAPYKATARTKTSDLSRRYLGAVKSNADATPRLLQFWREGNFVRYIEDHLTTMLVYSANPAPTSYTLITPTPFVPTGTRMVRIIFLQVAGSNTLLRSVDAAWTGTGYEPMATVGAWTVADMPLDANLQFYYAAAGAGGTITIVCHGYYERR